MDWYFIRDGADNLIVPHNQETSGIQHADDRSLYPIGWSQWEVGRTENSGSPNKLLSRSMEQIVTGINSHWQSLYENIDLQSSIHDGEGCSSQSAHADFGLVDSYARTKASFYDEKIDDFWESAFVEDPPSMNGLSTFQDSAYRSMPFGNLLTDMLMDPHDSLKYPSFMGSTFPKTSFGPVTDDLVEDEDLMEDVSPSLMTENSKSPASSSMASLLSVLVPAEQTTSEVVGHVQEKKYLQTTVLHELEDVMSQLNVETRICIRDALYRLAKISKQHHSFMKDKPSSEVHGANSCQGGPKSAESKTNVIDRTVANLMFNMPNSCPQVPPCPRSVQHQYVESCQDSGSYDEISKQPVIYPHHHHPGSPPGGIKVPSCRQENSNNGHSGCILSYFMPAGVDYISGVSDQADESVAIADQFSQAEDSAAIVDQLGANQQPKFTFATAFSPHRHG